MITLLSIIKEEWNNPLIDNKIKQVLEKNLWNVKLENPYSLTWVDILVNEIENHLKTTKLELSQSSINEAYKELYWYTSMQMNLWEFVNEYKNLKAKYKMILDYLMEYYKIQAENQIKIKVKEIYKNKNFEIRELEQSIADKKMTAVENKFLSTKLATIEDKYNAELLSFSPTKINATIYSRLKTNQDIIELERKINILEKITWYFDYRYKTFQEKINTHKKIIDNLVFLYNNANKQWNM